MKTVASLVGPCEEYFRQKNIKSKGQKDDSSFGHVESEVTFVYPDGDIQETVKYTGLKLSRI